MHNSPAAAAPKSFDLGRLPSFDRRFHRYCRCATGADVSIFLTDEVHARPGMVGILPAARLSVS